MPDCRHVNIQRTLMRACTALNNSLYVASVGRVMRKVRGVPALLITVAGYRLLRPGCALLGVHRVHKTGPQQPRKQRQDVGSRGHAQSGWALAGLVGRSGRRKLRAPGLNGGGSAYTSPDSMNARCVSHALPRPPWHGTRGFEAP